MSKFELKNSLEKTDTAEFKEAQSFSVKYIKTESKVCECCKNSFDSGVLVNVDNSSTFLCSDCSFKLEERIHDYLKNGTQSTDDEIFFLKARGKEPQDNETSDDDADEETEDEKKADEVPDDEANNDEEALLELRIGSFMCLVDEDFLKIIFAKLDNCNRFTYYEYNQPVIENPNELQSNILSHWEKKVQKVQSKYDYIGTFTEAQKKFYVHNDKLRNMISLRVNKKDTHSTYPEKLSYRFPFTKARVYSCIRSLPCITGSHSEAREAVTVIRTNRCDDFVLSFCEDCLYDFLKALKEIYYNDSMDEVQFNDTVILKREATEKCFFCGNKNEYEYFIQTGNYSFTLCEDCMNHFIKTVMYSSPVKELFEEEFNELRRNIALKNKEAQKTLSENADK